MKTANKINESWTDYDRLVGLCHLNAYGIIFLDEYDLPIDDIYETDELYSIFKSKEVK